MGFGILERAWNIGSGLVAGALQPVAFGVDLIKAPFSDDEYEGVWGTIRGNLGEHTGDFIENTIGPDKGFGALIGGLPMPIRDAGNTFFDGTYWLYKEGVNQPLSTLMTMGSIASEKGWDSFFEGDKWAEAYGIAETRSLGQAFAIAIGTRSIYDDEEVERVQGTGWYNAVSGLTDAAFAIVYDPLSIAGRAVTTLRGGSAGVVGDFILGGGDSAVGMQRVQRLTREPFAVLDNVTGKWMPRDAFGLRHQIGGSQFAKQEAWLKTVRSARAHDPQARNLFELYRHANKEVRGNLRTRLYTTARPRAVSDLGSAAREVDDYLASARYDVWSAKIHGLRHEVLRSRGIDPAVPHEITSEAIDELAGRIRNDLLSGVEKHTANVGAMSEILAISWTYFDDAGQQSIMRALMGDGAEISKLHRQVQMDLRGLGPLEMPPVNVAARAAVDDVLKRNMKEMFPRSTFDDTNVYQQTLDWVMDNADMYPQQVIGGILDDLVRTGRTDEAWEMLEIWVRSNPARARMTPAYVEAHSAGDLSYIDRVIRSSGYEPETMGGFGDLLTNAGNPRGLGELPSVGSEALNIQRLNALAVHSGWERVRRSMFIPKARALGDGTDLRGNNPIFKFEPQVTTRDRARWALTHQSSSALKPFRVFTQMTPHRYVDLADDKSDVQIKRILDNAGMDRKLTDELRGKYIAAGSVEERVRVFSEIEETIFTEMAKKHGLAESDIRHVLNHSKVSKHVAYQKLQGRNLQFDADRNTFVMKFEGKDEILEVPILATQNSRIMVNPDWHGLERSVRRYARKYNKYKDELAEVRVVDSQGVITRKADDFDDWMYGYEGQWLHRTGRRTHDGLQQIMKFWTPAVLLRPAWTMRVVLMDEQIRQIARFQGLLSFTDQLSLRMRSMGDFYDEIVKMNSPVGRALGMGKGISRSKSMARQSGAGALLGGLVAGPVGAAVGGITPAAARLTLGKKIRALQQAGYHMPGVADDIAMQNAFGAPGDRANYHRELVSAGNSDTMRALRGFTDQAYGDMTSMMPTGSYVARDHTNVRLWSQAFEDTFNNQIGQDPAAIRVVREMADMLDNGQSVSASGDELAESLLKWMNDTPEGQVHAARVGLRSQSPESLEEWSEAIVSMMQRYFAVDGNVDNLLARDGGVDLLRRVVDPEKPAVTADEWRQLFNDENLLPTIHGAEVIESLGRENSISAHIGDLVERAYEVFGRIPTDTLSRMPTFDALYKLEVRRHLGQFADESGGFTVTQAQMRNIERQAREAALAETRAIMYELAESSQFAEMSRLVMPFFNAWQEALTRHMGLIYENPQWLGADVRAVDWIFETDENGDDHMTFNIPEWASGLLNDGVLFKDAFANTGQVSFSKGSLNILSSTPGFGPLAQVPMAQVAHDRPELEGALTWMFPFGAPTDTVDAFLPTWGRRLKSVTQQEDDRAWATSFRQNLKTRLTLMELGEIPYLDMNDPAQRKEFIDEVKSQTDSLFRLRLAASLVAPSQPQFESPYQDMIDIYRDLQQKYPMSADEIFLESFGEDFFALTQSTTKTMNGVPPTLHGIEMEEKYGDLITSHPELGRLIVGDDGSAETEFIRSKYDAQLATGERRRLTPDEVVTGPDVRRGWREYSQFMDYIDYSMHERGLPNLRVAEAADLASMKRAMIEELANRNPAWASEFYEVDRAKWDRRITGLEAIAAHPDLNQRPDLAPLGQYLTMRSWVLRQLEARKSQGGSGTLDAVANQDIAAQWEDFTNVLVEGNPSFATVFYRYLDNDPVRSPLAGYGS